MLKFLAGMVVGAIFRDALIQAYRRNYFPYQERIDSAYYILRHGEK